MLVTIEVGTIPTLPSLCTSVVRSSNQRADLQFVGCRVIFFSAHPGSHELRVSCCRHTCVAACRRAGGEEQPWLLPCQTRN